jgi:tetratricopeptide (TPR) repeat protein
MTATGYDLHTPIMPKRAGAYQMTLDGVENAPYLDMTIPYAAGSLYSTAEDLYIWDQALYTDKVLPAKSREKMFTVALNNYAYGWVVRKGKAGDRGYTVIGHGGGINGFSTLIERLIEDRHLIVLLNNTGGARLEEMSQGIQNILYGAPLTPMKKPSAAALYQIVLNKGVEEAVKQAKAWSADSTSGYGVSSGDLATLASHLTKIKKTSEAIEIGKLNAELNPKVASAHYSLGESYREAGRRQDAIRAYAKALELNPDEGSPVAQRLKEMLSK